MSGAGGADALKLFYTDLYRNYEVEFDTVILLALTGGAFIWYMSFSIGEGRKEIESRNQEELDRLERAERLRKMYKR